VYSRLPAKGDGSAFLGFHINWIMGITLHPISRSNWLECIALQVNDDQKVFIVHNLYSLAEAKVNPSFVPLAVYQNDIIVGFTMYGIDPDDGRYWILRLMIDKNYQHKGYGKAAMVQVIDILKEKKDCHTITIGHKPENLVADRLYSSLGFHNTGEIICGDIIKRYVL
jgi:diamine N-acetyltransferase